MTWSRFGALLFAFLSGFVLATIKYPSVEEPLGAAFIALLSGVLATFFYCNSNG